MIARTFGFAAALAFGFGSIAAADTKDFDRILPLNANGTFELQAHNGTIQVHTWDKPQAEVHVHVVRPGLSASSSRFPTVDINGSADRVSVRWNNNRENWTFWSLFDSWGPLEVRFDITVPSTVRLDIHTHNARTEIHDFAGPLDLNTHNGRTRVDFAAFTQNAHVAMHNGTFEASMPASSKFNLDSRGHHVFVQSDFKSSPGGPDLRIVSHNAGVRLHSKG